MERRTVVRGLAVGALAVAVGRARALQGPLGRPAGSGPGGAAAAPSARGGGTSTTDRVESAPTTQVAPADPGATTTDGASAAMLAVVARDALGLEAAVRGGRPHRVDRLTVHHSAVFLDRPSDAPARLRAHQRHHRGHGWVDIAYHYGIDPSGTVYELRDPAIAGDTLTDYDPAGHLLILCEGDFDRQRPTAAMRDALVRLVAALAAAYDVDASTLAGHRDVAATACPGDALARELPGLRDAAARLTAEGAPELTLVDGPEASALLAAVEAA